MNVNIKNVLRNIKDKITFLNVVYESISNSIEANSTVINILFRKTDSIIEGEYLSDGFSITDNGDGFNKENRDSFLEYYTDHKLELGCKGVGRFTWLKVFGDVKIESYVEEKLVTSHFHEGYNDEFFENDYQEKPNYTTKIVFNNCFLAQKELLKLDLKEIKNKILEHFVIKFSMLNNSKRSFVINIGIENEKEKTTITNGDLFELNKIEFELEEFNSPISFCLYYSINDLLNDSKIVLCANKRAIEDINKTKKLINDLCDKKSIICFIEAKYLDDIVNDTRTGFLFSKNNEQTMSKRIKKKNENSKIKEFFRVIISAYSRKKDEDNEYTDKTFSLLSSSLFYFVGGSMLFFDIVLLIVIPIYYIKTFNWSNVLTGILGIMFSCVIIFFLFLLATLMIGTAKEQEKAKGEKSIVVFSAIVSFVALIVAVIALFK